MLIIGLTGGIGSGKSTVSEYLSKNMGLTIIDADQIARDVTRPGQETLLKLREAFGSEIINDDGTLDRRKLAGIAFQSDEKKKLLEKQKEGKKRMRQIGSVELPSEAFMSVLRIN